MGGRPLCRRPEEAALRERALLLGGTPGEVHEAAHQTSPSFLLKALSCLFSTVGKSSERASYSTFGRDTGMPGLNQVTIKCFEIFCFIYWLSCRERETGKEKERGIALQEVLGASAVLRNLC